jgi:hypothetical protein
MIIREDFAREIEAGDPNLRIRTILEFIFDSVQKDPEFWELFYSLRSQPAVMSVLGDQFRHWTSQLRELFSDNFREAGWKDPELVAYILCSLIDGTIQQHLMNPATFPLHTVIDRMIRQYSNPPANPKRSR